MVIATAMETAAKSERLNKFEKEWCRKRKKLSTKVKREMEETGSAREQGTAKQSMMKVK